jgi:hypothetical protein
VTFGANAIYGLSYNDIDGDGVRDAGEGGLDGVQIFLDADADGILDDGEISTYTDTNGSYAFRNLPFVDPVAFGPAAIVGNVAATPDAGTGQTTTSETSASTVVTTTEATFDFTLKGAAGLTGLSFDGNDVVTTKPSESLLLTGSSTLEIRFRYQASESQTPMVLVEKSQGQGGRTYSLWINAASGELALFSADETGKDQFWTLPRAAQVSAGEWHDLAAAIDREKAS